MPSAGGRQRGAGSAGQLGGAAGWGSWAQGMDFNRAGGNESACSWAVLLVVEGGQAAAPASACFSGLATPHTPLHRDPHTPHTFGAGLAGADHEGPPFGASCLLLPRRTQALQPLPLLLLLRGKSIVTPD